MSRVLTWILALPIGVVLVALAVANRRAVVLSLDPFRPDHPAVSVAVPLFALIFAALIVGILLGGVTVWWRQRIHRRAARQARRELVRAQGERERLAADLARQSAPAPVVGLPAAPPTKAIRAA